VKDRFEVMGNEAVVACSKVVSQEFMNELKKTTRSPNQDSCIRSEISARALSINKQKC
jgi:hypothetical protein